VNREVQSAVLRENISIKNDAVQRGEGLMDGRQALYHFAFGAIVTGAAFVAPAIAQDTAASAQAAKPGEIADIVVTAEKRTTSLQRTPIAVTALSGDRLATTQISDIRDISALVPNLKAGETGGYGQISIRGIGITNFTPLAESTVAVNLNQVYISRPSSFFTGLYDVASIEVLRGPQGTLYGRNATAGSVNITTNRPTDRLSGMASITSGNYSLFHAEAAISGPIIDDLLKVRVAGYLEKHDGYGKNVITGQDYNNRNAKAVRGTIELTPAQGLTATLIGEYYDENDDRGGGSFNYFGDIGLSGRPGALGVPSASSQMGIAIANSYDVARDFTEFYRLKVYTLTGILDYHTGPLSLKSITAYRNQKLLILNDPDGSSAPLAVYLSGEPAHQFSQELQAGYSQGRLNLTTGLYYFKETDAATPSMYAQSSVVTDPAVGLPPRAPFIINFANLGGTIRTLSRAAFAQASYEMIDHLTLTAGIRYSKDTKQLTSRYLIDLFTPYSPDAPLPSDLVLPKRSWASWTPKFGLQFQATPRTLLYATYAKGFKAGGFDASANPGGGTVDTSFEPEKLTSYEVGIKTKLLNNRLRANIAGFYYDYTDLQVSVPSNLSVITQNAASAKVYGIEGELTFLPVPELELGLNASYLHSAYKHYVAPDPGRPLIPVVDFSGNALNNSPRFSGLASAQYTMPVARGALVLRGELEFTTRFFFSPGNYDLAGQGGFAKGNLFVTYRHDNGLSVTAFVRNVTDKMTRTSALISNPFLGTPVSGSLAPPRTYGVQLSFRY
jgi:iron complex outermembrane receptor protein